MLKDLILYLYDKELSRAEVEVFLLMACGYTYQEVADLRCCALKTVKYHITGINSKLKIVGRKGILKIIITIFLPDLKNQIINYLYSHKENVDRLLWSSKLGED